MTEQPYPLIAVVFATLWLAILAFVLIEALDQALVERRTERSLGLPHEQFRWMAILTASTIPGIILIVIIYPDVPLRGLLITAGVLTGVLTGVGHRYATKPD